MRRLTFNHWLDTLTFDERTYDPAAWKGFSVIDSTRGDGDGMREMVIPHSPKPFSTGVT